MSACKLTGNRNDILGLWGVGHFDELSEEQLQELALFMEDAYRGKTTNAPERTRMLRSQCLKRLTGAHDDPNEKARGLSYPNEWVILNRAMLKYTRRLLYMLSDAELMAFHRQLCRIRQSWWYGKQSRAEAIRQASASVADAPTPRPQPTPNVQPWTQGTAKERPVSPTLIILPADNAPVN